MGAGETPKDKETARSCCLFCILVLRTAGQSYLLLISLMARALLDFSLVFLLIPKCFIREKLQENAESDSAARK